MSGPGEETTLRETAAPQVAIKTADISSVAYSIVQATLGLKEGTELPEYFRMGGQYAEDQFKIGWTARSIIAGRIQGDQASFLTHPDAGTDYEKLPEGVKKFVQFFSTLQVAIYGKLSVAELQELKTAGGQYAQALASVQPGTVSEEARRIYVNEPLLGKVNVIHHQLWMAARDLARVIDPTMAIRNHSAHMEHSIMTPEQIAADNPSVQGYALILNKMPQPAFDYLLGKCTN